MYTNVKRAFYFVLLISLGGVANAQPPTDLVGSWNCEVGGSAASLVSFNLGGTFTASLATSSTSTNHGTWLRTGLNTFISKDLAYIFGSSGAAEFIQITDANISVPDNDNLTATLSITITDLNGVIVGKDSVLTSCVRIQV